MTRILVVDDDRPQAEEFGVLLRHAGCEVTLAGNGREAMDLLRHGVPLERIGGRGQMLIRTFMDEVEHNEKGNRITLRKRYPAAACPRPPADSR